MHTLTVIRKYKPKFNPLIWVDNPCQNLPILIGVETKFGRCIEGNWDVEDGMVVKSVIQRYSQGGSGTQDKLKTIMFKHNITFLQLSSDRDTLF